MGGPALKLAAMLLNMLIIIVYCGALDIACGCKSYADLFRVFLPISRILVFAATGVQVRNSLRHGVSKSGTFGASRLSRHGRHYNADAACGSLNEGGPSLRSQAAI